MTASFRVSRRTALKGLGTAIALPLLEGMSAERLFGSSPTASGPPVRMLFVYTPNGVWMDDWTPKTTGTNYELSNTLKPLAPFKEDFMVLSGLDSDKARNRYTQPGSVHARAQGTFLTGAIPLREKAQVGVSVDQVAAQTYGKKTRFPSLELGAEASTETGEECRSYPCAYFQSLSWRGPSSPCSLEIHPRLVFERLFANQDQGEGAASRALREQHRKSILDFVKEDATQLRAKLGASDKRKLEEYFTAVREVEMRIARFEADSPLQVVDSPDTHADQRALRELRDRIVGFRGATEQTRYTGPEVSKWQMYSDFESHIKLLSDLLVLAFQTDVTRIATFMFGREGSLRSYPWLGIKGAYHSISHHGNQKDKIDQIRTIDRCHTTLFAYLLEKMKAVKEGGSTLLDNSMVVYGGGMSDGNSHAYGDLPIVLAGKAGGRIRSGRHVRYPAQVIQDSDVRKPDYKCPNVPVANLWLSMLHRLGVEAESFGDSTGALDLS